tara:strand:+ start:7679 stop:8125 length:447 start_codon:yes stop_codon:yes gene_type:complete
MHCPGISLVRVHEFHFSGECFSKTYYIHLKIFRFIIVGPEGAGDVAVSLTSGLKHDISWFGDLAISHAVQHFQNFTPGGELSPAASFVIIHGFHEVDFLIAVITFARGGIDLATTLDFALIDNFMFCMNRFFLACISAIDSTTVDNQF